MSLSKKLKLLSQSQSNNCPATTSWIENDYKPQSVSAQALDFNSSEDPKDVLNNNRGVVSSSSPNFHVAVPNQQSFMLPFNNNGKHSDVDNVKSTSVPDVIKSCARSPPGTNDNNTNYVDSTGQKFKETFQPGQIKSRDFNNFQKNQSQISAIHIKDSSNSLFFSDEEYFLGDECSGESFSGSPLKDISSSRAPPESPPREDIEKYNLKPVSCLQAKYQSIFPTFTHFNRVQSDCLEDLLSSSDPVVVSAPTGCGKTVVFELAIIKQLQEQQSDSMKIVYIAPVKALCSERFNDWKLKFTSLGLNILELTGDSDHENLGVLKNHNFVITTPEKFDSVTRWLCLSDPLMMMSFKLVMIDEVHMLNDKDRGHVLEAVVSRLKTSGGRPRFVAASATFPNVEDIALWLGGIDCVFFKFDESIRPVQLEKVVVGYPMRDGESEFKFEMNLSYKIPQIISQHSRGAPCLVFCCTRKSTMNTASILSTQARYPVPSHNIEMLKLMSRKLTDTKLRELVSDHHIGYHHAGMGMEDRKIIEQMFSSGLLPVLTCTSTLALGVNLPAQLVIIKNTQQMIAGIWRDYTESQILQMAGRAGRPQFCKSATVVIMTQMKDKMKYEQLMVGSNPVESSLHLHLHEHLNAEIILGTISSIEQALDWIRSTYLFMRMKRNPTHYGLNSIITLENLEANIQHACQNALQSMANVGMIIMSENGSIGGTSLGRVMSRYYLSYSTMKLLTSDMDAPSMEQLLIMICETRDLADTVLRITEKETLNKLNKNREKKTVRFPFPGKIKTKEMKVNILLQASLGCMSVTDVGLNMETPRLLRLAARIATCLVEVVLRDPAKSRDFVLVKNTLLLSQSLNCGLWEDSEFVSKQMVKVGVVLSNAIANAGFKDLSSLSEANPRMLELATKKPPPFGNNLRDWALAQPRYNLQVTVGSISLTSVNVKVTVTLGNRDLVRNKSQEPNHHKWVLVIGCGNTVISICRGSDALLMSSSFTKNVTVLRREWEQDAVEVKLISLSVVGVDKTEMVNIVKPGDDTEKAPNIRSDQATFLSKFRRECGHSCNDKSTCKHDCCKSGRLHPGGGDGRSATPRKQFRFMENINHVKSSFSVEKSSSYSKN